MTIDHDAAADQNLAALALGHDLPVPAAERYAALLARTGMLSATAYPDEAVDVLARHVTFLHAEELIHILRYRTDFFSNPGGDGHTNIAGAD